jgi:hypothetical protein
MNVSLHIECLVLDGLPLRDGQGPVLQAALETELSRLLERDGLPELSGGAVPQLSAAAIQLSPGAPPAHWGAQIAQSLHASLAPARKPNSETRTRTHGARSNLHTPAVRQKQN